MVNKVNGNDYYDYSKLKMPDASDKMAGDEKFSLNYQRAQDETETKNKNDDSSERQGDDSGGRRTTMQGGVKLELSGNSKRTADAKRVGSEREQATGQGIVETIRSYVSVIVQSLKDFLYRIWNDAPPQEVEQIEEVPQEEKLSEEYLALHPQEKLEKPEAASREPLQRKADKDQEIQKYLRSGNLEGVIDLLTENGHKTMAKNSTLLTYYDRSGKITPLSASDQERILHGDRNVREL